MMSVILLVVCVWTSCSGEAHRNSFGYLCTMVIRVVKPK